MKDRRCYRSFNVNTPFRLRKYKQHILKQTEIILKNYPPEKILLIPQ